MQVTPRVTLSFRHRNTRSRGVTQPGQRQNAGRASLGLGGASLHTLPVHYSIRGATALSLLQPRSVSGRIDTQPQATLTSAHPRSARCPLAVFVRRRRVRGTVYDGPASENHIGKDARRDPGSVSQEHGRRAYMGRRSKLLRRLLAKPKPLDEPINIHFERVISDRFCLSAHQQPHVLRQLIFFRHRRSVEQHRHNGYGARKGRANLNADKVFGIVEPSPARLISVSNPVTANERKYDLALPNAANLEMVVRR
jgi:hypothetical protein